MSDALLILDPSLDRHGAGPMHDVGMGAAGLEPATPTV